MSTPVPFYADNAVTLYCGDMREIVPHLQTVDAVVTDPPYGETSLAWDIWPKGWPELMAAKTSSLWCFGSMRMFLEQFPEFSAWRLSQDIVWEKHNGTNPQNDRFRRVHEMAMHFYRGEWRSLHKSPVYTNDAKKTTVRRKGRPPQWGEIGESVYRSEDGGPRLMTSVIYCRSCHGHASHPTQKPEGIIRPLIEYSIPPGGVVLDPFAGSGTTLAVARELGRRAIGIEQNPEYCREIVKRLGQGTLNLQSAI